MDNSAIYSKTSKGMNELKGGAKNIPRDDARILTLIDGISNVDDISNMLDSTTNLKLVTSLGSLLSQGLIRVFSNGSSDAYRELSMDTQQQTQFTTDGLIKFTQALPTIQVTELTLRESVQAWAEARRGAAILEKKGFYTYGQKTSNVDSIEYTQALRVMVVEDDESLSHLLETLLKHKNFEVQIVDNIVGAITTLSALSAPENGPLPDLVLLDVMLPGLPGKDGFHVLEYIRRHPALQQIPVIMVTSQITDEYVMRGLKAEADGYIFKPFKWQTLYECIQSVTGK